MKVLLTHERFPPDFAGGGEYVALRTAQHLMRRGVEVRVLTTGDPEVASYDGIETERLPVHPYRFNLAAGEIARRAGQVDLLQTFNYHAAFPSFRAGKRLGVPTVCTIFGLFGDEWWNMRGRLAGTGCRC